MPNNNDARRWYRHRLVRWYIKLREWRRSDPDERGPEPEIPIDPPELLQTDKRLMKMKISYDVPPHRYELALSWNDGEFIDEGKVGFLIAATRYGLNEDGSISYDNKKSIEASVSIVPKDSENPVGSDPILRVSLPAENEFYFDLKELLDDSSVLEKIPASAFSFGDPILGCLIRSGLSSSISQIIKCKNETAGVGERFFPRTKFIGKCLINNIPGLSGKIAVRAGLCVFKTQ